MANSALTEKNIHSSKGWHLDVSTCALPHFANKRVALPQKRSFNQGDVVHQQEALQELSHHLAGVCAVLRGYITRERVCLSRGRSGRRVRSAARAHVSGCAYHFAGVCAALSGCTWAGVPTIWQACAQRCTGAT